MEIAGRHGVAVVEDNAHASLVSIAQAARNFGVMAAQSFHETKNFSCGEGGAIVINDPSYLERAEIIREKGTNRRKFFRLVSSNKYTWVDIGSSYLPSTCSPPCCWLSSKTGSGLGASQHGLEPLCSGPCGMVASQQCSDAVRSRTTAGRHTISFT